MVLFLSVLTGAVALALLFGLPLLMLWALAHTDEDTAAKPLVKIAVYKFHDRRFWEAFVSWMRTKPERLVHYKPE